MPAINTVPELSSSTEIECQHTPTVVKTSCSLLTRVMRPGSLTLMLRATLVDA